MSLETLTARRHMIQATRAQLSELSERERGAIINFCAAFSLVYGDILPLLNFTGRQNVNKYQEYKGCGAVAALDNDGGKYVNFKMEFNAKGGAK
jgi:hypothetical protein